MASPSSPAETSLGELRTDLASGRADRRGAFGERRVDLVPAGSEVGEPLVALEVEQAQACGRRPLEDGIDVAAVACG